MADFFDLSINIKAIDKASANLRQIEKSSGEMSTNMKRHFKETSEALDKIGKKSLLLGGALAAGLGAGVKVAADFEQEMQNIKAVTGSSQADMKKFHDLSLKAGVDTKYSALEAAQGIEELSKAGLSTAQILNGGLYGALNLATAGDIQVADAAEIASTALNAFRDDNISVAKAADILSGAANASATSVGELKYSLSMCSAVAAGIGMNFRDTNTALALLAQNGLKGSDAGTSLKTMLMNLQPHTKAQVGAFIQLGLAEGKLIKTSKSGKKTYEMTSNAFFDQHGNLKNLTNITDILHEKLKGLTNQQRMSALQTLFGTDAVRAANILYREGSKGATDMWTAMSKVTAAQVGETKMKSLNGSLETLSGSLQTIGIDMGESLLPGINVLVKGVTVLANAFEGLPSPIKSIISIGGALTAVGLIAFGGLAIGVSAVMNAIVDCGGAFVGISAKFPAIARGVLMASRSFMTLGASIMETPVGLFVGIAAVIGIAAFAIYKYWKPISGFFSGVFSGIKQALKPTIIQFKELLKPFAPLGAAVKSVGAWFGKFITPVKSSSTAVNSAGLAVGKFIGGILNGVIAITKFIVKTNPLVAGLILIYKNFDKIKSAVAGAFQKVQSFFALFGGKKDINVNANVSGSGSSLPTAKSKGPMPKFDVGSRGITRTGMAVVHENEVISTAKQAKQGLGGNTFHFSPQISVSGGGGNVQAQVEQAVKSAFNKCMQEFNRNQARLAY